MFVTINYDSYRSRFSAFVSQILNLTNNFWKGQWPESGFACNVDIIISFLIITTKLLYKHDPKIVGHIVITLSSGNNWQLQYHE